MNLSELLNYARANDYDLKEGFITPQRPCIEAAPENISLSKRCAANADKMNVRAPRLSYLIEDSSIAALLKRTEQEDRAKRR